VVQDLFQNVIEVTLTTSVVIAALLLLLPLIHKNYTAKWQYWVWLVLAVRLLIPFSPSLPQTPIEITPPSQNIEFKVPVQNTVSSPLPNNAPVPQAAKDSTAAWTITLNGILFIVWVLGIAVFLLYHSVGYFLFKRSVLRFSRPVEGKRTTGLWCEVKEEMNVRQNIRLLSCRKVKSPMMTGFFKPILLLPDLGFSSSDLKIILKHELIHYKRRDIWYKLLLVCANAVHWFNPLIYFMVTMSNKDIEMVCDSEIIRDSDVAFRKQYSDTILSAIHKGNIRRMAFSTYFYGGKKTMKERFVNIFDMNKKRRGMVALCMVLAAVCTVGGLVACQQNGVGNTKLIDNISLLDSGNSYSFDGNRLTISYHKGKTTAEVELPIDISVTYAEEQTGAYISEEKTAVAYGGLDGQSPVKVMVSGDMGKTWNTYTVKGSDSIDDNFIGKRTGFISSNDGWLVLDGNAGAGTQNHYIYQTEDGGRTWTQIGNSNEVYAKMLTGASFASDNIGFLCFIRIDDSPAPTIYRTEDRGQTWEKLEISLPKEYQSGSGKYRADALSPVFNGANGVLPVIIYNTAGSELRQETEGRYSTLDFGKTWTYGTSSDGNATHGTTGETGSIVYENAQYGFRFSLLESWKGNTIVTGKWEGLATGDSQGEKVVETGPTISIRHPRWTSENLRQDIPIMVSTLAQWNSLQQGKFHIGAAPVDPSELGRNSKYVFALPARYNYAFPTGYEEVETILNSNSLQPTEDINPDNK